MQQNRHHPRIRSFLKGEIIHSAGAIRIDCTVRDLSPDGARLQVPRSVPLPDPLDLNVLQRNIHERCTITWRHGDEVGVNFHTAKRPDSWPEQLQQPMTNDRALQVRMERVEAEIAHLKQQLASMRSILERLNFEKG